MCFVILIWFYLFAGRECRTYMKYPEFREELLNVLKSMVTKEVKVRLVQAEKLNGCMRFGVSFDSEGMKYSPTIYLEPFYRSFQRGKSIEEIAKELFACYEEELHDVPESVESLHSYESARENIYCKLIHLEENKCLLQNTPHIIFLDFAIVAYFEVNHEEIYKGSVLIKDYFLERWQITEEELINNALLRTKEKKEVFFRPMSEILYQYISEEDGDFYEYAQKGMFVLTNTEKYLGAIMVYYPEVLSGVASTIKEDFYLLPSSIHEWIVVPISTTSDEDELLRTVRDINHSAVLEEEVLSDNIYLYTVTAGDERIRCITEFGVKSA